MRARRILLWRHGRTAFNAAGRFQGQHDVPLDETGLAQAAAAAPGIASLGFDLLISSDLTRAMQTAQAVAALTGRQVHAEPRLREVLLGGFQGLTRAEAIERYPEEFARWRAGQPVTTPGWESAAQVAARALAAVSDADADSLLVTSHGYAIRTLICAVLGLPEDHWGVITGMANCHYSELRHGRRGWYLETHNAPAPGQPPSARYGGDGGGLPTGARVPAPVR